MYRNLDQGMSDGQEVDEDRLEKTNDPNMGFGGGVISFIVSR